MGGPPVASPAANDADEDDAHIEASRAPLLDHLLELRRRLIVMVIAVVLGFILGFVFAEHIYRILLVPFTDAAARARGVSGEDLDLKLIFTGPLEFFFVKLRLALFGGVILAFPLIAHQIYAFVAPGLYKNERGAFLPYLLAGPVLFCLGGLLVYSFILPQVLTFAFSQEVSGGEGQASIELLPRVSEYLSLVTTLILAFGFAFQMPVILTLMAHAGLITAKTLISYWKYALLGIFVVAAVLTPPDPMSQIALGGCIFGLYWLSVLAVKLIEKNRGDDADDDAAVTPAP